MKLLIKIDMTTKLETLANEKKELNIPIKLHIGCGTIYKEGWINIDNNSDNNIEKFDFDWDLSKSLPLASESVDFVYHEHFIEHLTYEQGQSFLKDIFRLLKIGGIMRIACPDLDYIIDGYVKNNWRQQDWVTAYNCQGIRSRCQMMNMNLNKNTWGHQYVYNKEDLIAGLKTAGFSGKNIKEVLFSESIHEDLRGLENRKDSLIFEVEK